VQAIEMKRVLITNQHGENRGDESALRALLDGLSSRFDNISFTVIAQLQDTSLEMNFKEDVSLLHMKMSVLSFLGLVIYAFFQKIGLSLPILLDQNTGKIIAAYKTCDVVVSAPGGPYFGDIYSNHEIVHWFYIWLGRLYKKPLFLYAPSAGPFEIKWLNYIRKHFYSKFDVLSLREDISKGYLEDLIGLGKEIHVTADSALQQSVEPMARDKYFVGSKSVDKTKFLVAVSAIEYKFPGTKEPEARRQEYTQILLKCLHHLASRKNCHFLFIPQLYGKVHTDVPYLKSLSSKLPDNATWEIVDQAFDSDAQRSIFGMCDLCIASRYHPQIFSGSSGVSGICIYYEHKALGFMRAMGLEDFAFDIRKLDIAAVTKKLDEAIDRRKTLSEAMKRRILPIRNRSKQTTNLLIELMDGQRP
jgi:colanic acid/amylovoran biosynthesis protein